MNHLFLHQECFLLQGSKYPSECYLLILDLIFPLSSLFSSYLDLVPDYCAFFIYYYGHILVLKQLHLLQLHVYGKQ